MKENVADKLFAQVKSIIELQLGVDPSLIGAAQDPNVYCVYVAEHLYEFRTRTGRIFTADDVKQFLLEVAKAAEVPALFQGGTGA